MGTVERDEREKASKAKRNEPGQGIKRERAIERSGKLRKSRVSGDMKQGIEEIVKQLV